MRFVSELLSRLGLLVVFRVAAIVGQEGRLLAVELFAKFFAGVPELRAGGVACVDAVVFRIDFVIVVVGRNELWLPAIRRGFFQLVDFGVGRLQFFGDGVVPLRLRLLDGRSVFDAFGDEVGIVRECSSQPGESLAFSGGSFGTGLLADLFRGVWRALQNLLGRKSGRSPFDDGLDRLLSRVRAIGRIAALRWRVGFLGHLLSLQNETVIVVVVTSRPALR